MPRIRTRNFTNAIVCDGLTSKLVKNSPTGYNSSTNISFAVWACFNSDNIGTLLDLVASAGVSRAFTMLPSSGSYYIFSDRFNSGNNILITGAEFSKIGTGRFRRLVYTLSSTTVSLYCDGVLIKTATLGVTISASTVANIYLAAGKAGSDIQWSAVTLKDAQIYTKVLSQAEVTNDYYNNDRPSNLQDSYLMEEGSGTTVASTGPNDLTLTNCAWTATQLPMKGRVLKSGRVAASNRAILVNRPNSLSFNGTTSYGSTTVVPFNNTNQFTIKGWFNFTSLVSVQLIMEQSSNLNTNNSCAISIDPGTSGGNRITFGVHGNTGNKYSMCSSVPILAGAWYYATFTYDGTLSSKQAKVYTNATLGTVYYLDQQVTDNMADNILYFATRNLNTYFGGFKVRDFSIITGKAYNEAEVYSDFRNQGGVAGGTKVFEVRCNETSGITASDSSGNGNTLTTGGSAVFVAQGPVSRTLIT